MTPARGDPQGRVLEQIDQISGISSPKQGQFRAGNTTALVLPFLSEKPQKTRRTLGSFVNFGLEIQNWESTSSLISKVVIN